jgi:hypothetical protein
MFGPMHENDDGHLVAPLGQNQAAGKVDITAVECHLRHAEVYAAPRHAIEVDLARGARTERHCFPIRTVGPAEGAAPVTGLRLV